MKLRRNIWLWIAGGALVTPLLLPLLFIASVFCIQVGYELAGYHAFVFNGEKIAQIAIQSGDPRECYKIRVVFAINTNTYLEEQYCIYTYAKLTRDPSACELLMPGEYGWSCLGAARKKGEACDINYGKDASWWVNSVFDQPQKATLDECKRGVVATDKGRKCCYILQLSSEKNIDDCSLFESDAPFLNLCLSQLAMKRGEQELCKGIFDDNARMICEIRVKYRGTD